MRLINAFFVPIVLVSLLISMAVWMNIRGISMDDPPGGSRRDNVFYDNIGLHLSQGKGFVVDFKNQQWLKTYENDPRNNWIFKSRLEGPTAKRAPGYPYCLSVLYRVLGRNWVFVRIFNYLVLAAGLTTLVVVLRKHLGTPIASVTAGSLLFDFAILGTAGELMTEPLTTGLFSVTFAAVIWAWSKTDYGIDSADRRGGSWRWAVVGILFALTALVRSNFYAWLIQLLVLSIVWLVFLIWRKRHVRTFAGGLVAFLLAVSLICFPWWARNCYVTGNFAPFGTAGSSGLVGGYSDGALEKYGNWDVRSAADCAARFRDANYAELAKMSLAEQEYLIGQQSQLETRAWIIENWRQVPLLMTYKALNHLRLIRQPTWNIALNVFLLSLAAIGCVAYWRQFGFWVVLVVFLSTAATMLTWSGLGRYSVPMRPVIQCAVGAGTVYIWILATKLPGRADDESTNGTK